MESPYVSCPAQRPSPFIFLTPLFSEVFPPPGQRGVSLSSRSLPTTRSAVIPEGELTGSQESTTFFRVGRVCPVVFSAGEAPRLLRFLAGRDNL